MVTTEFVAVAISLTGIIIEIISTRFNKKEFRERFDRYELGNENE